MADHGLVTQPDTDRRPATDPATPAFWRDQANRLRRIASQIERNADRLAAGTFPNELTTRHRDTLASLTNDFDTQLHRTEETP